MAADDPVREEHPTAAERDASSDASGSSDPFDPSGPSGPSDPSGAVASQPFTVFPNPARDGVTTVAFHAPEEPVAIDVALYTVSGRRVRTLVQGHRSGIQSVPWNGRSDDGLPVPAGVYMARLSMAAGAGETQRILVLR